MRRNLRGASSFELLEAVWSFFAVQLSAITTRRADALSEFRFFPTTAKLKHNG